jgi:hypothetical protein
MMTNRQTNPELIAPCGMNCGICMAKLRQKNKCPGCRGKDDGKPVTRLGCKIKSCENLNSKFCYTCVDFPCLKLKKLDKRYRIKYNMSMIENLEYIKKYGVVAFLDSENVKWTCSECGGVICVHKGLCSNCGKRKK